MKYIKPQPKPVEGFTGRFSGYAVVASDTRVYAIFTSRARAREFATNDLMPGAYVEKITVKSVEDE